MEVNVVNYNDTHLDYWFYTDVLGHSDCDTLVSHFEKIQGEQATIFKNSVDGSDIDTSIRNVKRIPIPTYKGLGAILTGVGMDANRQRWKFIIDGSVQAEILRYPSGGRYTGHIDTILDIDENAQKYCRKLTALAFLNDNYVGGKFFLQMEEKKFYPPQDKGTILIFPSFLLHGVEDITEGERFTAVSWLVGPFFK